ncbi:MAG: DUF262 domain-containing protein [Rubellimicrobium sp.]|nr:DUF262 domain-containing protein [Rubellimicrobium sp.]
MTPEENFLHTTHRTTSWFKKSSSAGELELSPPFQRNAVWTRKQQSYLIDTIIRGFPIPELYMQDKTSSDGSEKSVVVDGQQRVRAVLGFVLGEYALEGDDVDKAWRGRKFDELSEAERRAIFGYKFVARILPESLDDEGIRRIFSRLNKNVVALTEQELRNSTYWGGFISAVQRISDDIPYWSEAAIFTANEVRRMGDQEFISELLIAWMHGPQNKKDKLDHFYQLYEEEFEDADYAFEVFSKTAATISIILPNIKATRWRKKSDFYTLFLEIAARHRELPFSADVSDAISNKLGEFQRAVDDALKIEAKDRHDLDRFVADYANAVARAASDRANRVARATSLSQYVFKEPSKHI